MTDRKLLQEALDALEFPHDSEWSNKAKAIEALQHALAQPEQEPVAWVSLIQEAQTIVEGKYLFKRFIDGTPLSNDIVVWMTEFALKYAAPPKREWVGLTSEELATIVVEHAGFPTKQAQAINEKLKEKNG